MKKLIATAILSLIVVSGWAQGTVDFRNGGITFRSAADRLVKDVDGTTPLVGVNYVAQLFYVAGASADLSHALASGTPVTFRVATTLSKGIWLPTSLGNTSPIRILDGVGENGTATLQVRVWDITKFQSYDAAKAAGGLTGASAPFAYTVPAAGNQPDAYYMDNLRGFALVPEPSTIALGVLGLGSLLLFRRRK